MLGNQWRTIIKTTHSKVKHVMKAFNTTNDTIKLSVMVEGFDKTLQDLKTAFVGGSDGHSHHAWLPGALRQASLADDREG